MIAPLDYLTGNSLIRYPFKDTASLKSTNGNVLSDDVLLDAQIVITSEATRAYLSKFSKALTLLDFEIKLTDAAGSIVQTISITKTASSIADKETITFSNNDCAIKLVPGPGCVTLATGADFSYTYSLTTAEFAGSVVIPQFPKITKVQFKNYVNNVSTLETEVTDEINIDKGHNFSMTRNSTGLSLRVSPGEGKGLYDPATVIEEGIRSINKVLPTALGKFNVIADDCYRIIHKSHGIDLKATCEPKCTEKQVAAYAYYLNRVKDGLLLVGDYAKGIQQTLEEAIENYKEEQRRKVSNAIPYMTGATAVSRSGTKRYLSFSVGIQDPRKANLENSTLSISYPPELTYVSGTSILNTGSLVQPLADSPGFTGKILTCKSSVIYGFVLQTEETSINRNVTMTLTHTEGAALLMMTVLPTQPYVNARYATLKKDNEYMMNVTVDMFDPSALTRNTTLVITMPAGFQQISGTGKLNLNNTITNTNTTVIPSTSIDFRHKASFSFQGKYVGTPGTFNIPVQLTTNAGTVTKNLPIAFV